MLTPELHISDNFTTADRISSETLWTYCAELKKTKAVIFALCMRGRVKAMINLVQYNIGPGTMIAIPSESFVQVLKTSDDVQLHAVLFSLAFIHETHLDRSIIHTFYIINEHPLLPLSPKIFGIYVQTFALLTHIHKDDAHGHSWPTATLPSWTIAKGGLAGALGGMALMFGFAAGANAQARRIGRAGEKRYQLYLAHEDLRAQFNAQAERPKMAQYVPSNIRIQQPMTLSVKKIVFKAAPQPKA